MGRFSGGWVKISRSLCDGSYDALDIGILFWLICNANYVDGKSLARSGHKRVIVKRGSLVTSVKEIESTLGLTRGSTRNRLKNFVEEGILAIETTNTGSIITICNYDKYQSMEGMEEPAVEPSDNHQTTIRQPSDNHILKKVRKKESKNIQDHCSENEHCDNKAEMANAIVNVWNQTLTSVLPPVSKLTDKRKKLLGAQLKKYPDIEHWQQACDKVKASDFLTGRSSEWKCNFDWVLNENNRTKILEGNYDNKGSSNFYKEPERRWLEIPAGDKQ